MLVDPARDSLPARRERVHVPGRDPHDASPPASTTTKSSSASRSARRRRSPCPLPRPARRESRDSSTSSSRVSPGSTWRRKRARSMPPKSGRAPVEPLVQQHRRGAELGHRLDEQHARDGRAAREVALEERLVGAHVPAARGALARGDRGHLGEEQEGRRDAGARARGRRASRSSAARGTVIAHWHRADARRVACDGHATELTAALRDAGGARGAAVPRASALSVAKRRQLGSARVDDPPSGRRRGPRGAARGVPRAASVRTRGSSTTSTSATSRIPPASPRDGGSSSATTGARRALGVTEELPARAARRPPHRRARHRRRTARSTRSTEAPSRCAERRGASRRTWRRPSRSRPRRASARCPPGSSRSIARR